MGVITTIDAAIDDGSSDIECVRKFSIFDATKLYAAYCSASADASSRAGPIRKDGNDDWWGQWAAYGGQPAVMPGTDFTFQGNDRAGQGFTGSAIGARADIIWDIEGGTYIHNFVKCEADGALTADQVHAPVIDDDGTPAPLLPLAKAEQTMILDSGSPVNQTDLTYIRLTLVSKNARYVTSSTANATKREAGNRDLYLTWRRYFSENGDLPTRGTVYNVKIYTTASLFWEIEDIRVNSVKRLWDIEGGQGRQGKLVLAEITGEWHSRDADDSEGHVILPDTTYWFGAA